MENNTLITLEEIREMVLRHLDAVARKEAVQICRSYYETNCRLENNKTLTLDDKVGYMKHL